MSVIKTIYMQPTIKYLMEIFGNKETEVSKLIITKGKPKLCSNGTAYILIEEITEDNNFTPAA